MKDLTKYLHRDILKPLLKENHINGIIVVGNVTKEAYRQVFFIPADAYSIQENEIYTVDVTDLREYRIGGIRINKEMPILVFDVDAKGKLIDREAITHFQTLAIYQEGQRKASEKIQKEESLKALAEVEQAELDAAVTQPAPQPETPEETTEDTTVESTELQDAPEDAAVEGTSMDTQTEEVVPEDVDTTIAQEEVAGDNEATVSDVTPEEVAETAVSEEVSEEQDGDRPL